MRSLLPPGPMALVVVLSAMLPAAGRAVEPEQGQARPRSGDMIDPAAKPLPPTAVQAIDPRMTVGQVIHQLGPAHARRGSGLCILVWRVTDGREFALGTSGCHPDELPIYAKFL